MYYLLTYGFVRKIVCNLVKEFNIYIFTINKRIEIIIYNIIVIYYIYTINKNKRKIIHCY